MISTVWLRSWLFANSMRVLWWVIPAFTARMATMMTKARGMRKRRACIDGPRVHATDERTRVPPATPPILGPNHFRCSAGQGCGPLNDETRSDDVDVPTPVTPLLVDPRPSNHGTLDSVQVHCPLLVLAIPATYTHPVMSSCARFRLPCA